MFNSQNVPWEKRFYYTCPERKDMMYKANDPEEQKIYRASLAVDNSDNYENRQQWEIQSVYFGYKAFSIYTACISNQRISFSAKHNAIVSEDMLDNKYGAFQCNKKLISHAKQLVPGLRKKCFFIVM